MTPTADLTRQEMVSAAAARCIVRTATGKVGRLTRWDSPKSRGRARIITTVGTGITLRLEQVTHVDLTPTNQPQEASK